MTALEGLVKVLTHVVAFALGVVAGPCIARWVKAADRRQAIRLHAQGWTHGQIAELQDREPSQVARWLAAADAADAS